MECSHFLQIDIHEFEWNGSDFQLQLHCVVTIIELHNLCILIRTIFHLVNEFKIRKGYLVL